MKIVVNKPTITRKELEGVLDCLINDDLESGETVRTFEAALAKIPGFRFSLAVNSLAAAYHLAYRALEITTEHEIIIPSFCTHHPLSALQLCGGTPVLVDIEEQSLFPSIEAIKSRITDKTRAVVVQHLFGYRFPVEGFRDMGIPVIEDISHVIGTDHEEVPAGRDAAFAVASFDPTGIITTGNGGIVMTNNSRHFSLMRDLRGASDSHVNFDYTMTDFQAAMGTSQLLKLNNLIARRRDIARLYHDALKTTEHRTLFQFNDSFAYQTFPVVFSTSSERVDQYWKKARIEVNRPLPAPLHTLLGHSGLQYPQSDRLAKKMYSVPLYPTLTKKEIEKIARALAGFV